MVSDRVLVAKQLVESKNLIGLVEHLEKEFPLLDPKEDQGNLDDYALNWGVEPISNYFFAMQVLHSLSHLLETWPRINEYCNQLLEYERVMLNHRRPPRYAKSKPSRSKGHPSSQKALKKKLAKTT